MSSVVNIFMKLTKHIKYIIEGYYDSTSRSSVPTSPDQYIDPEENSRIQDIRALYHAFPSVHRARHLYKVGLLKTSLKNLKLLLRLTDENGKIKPRIGHPYKAEIDEAGMGGISRAAPSTDVSYQEVLNDVYDKWRGEKTKARG